MARKPRRRSGDPYAWLLEHNTRPAMPDPGFALADPAAGPMPGPAPGTGIAILRIETVQAIQDLDHSVPLIAGKKTVVRVYLDHAGASSAVRLRGELEAARGSSDGPASYVPTADTVDIDPLNPLALAAQRHNLKNSLNFILPSELTRAGPLWLKLGKLVNMEGVEVPHIAAPALRIEFVPGPVLRMRVIGYRYSNAAGDRTFAPDAIHFAYLRSFLTRALPISELRWSQIVLDSATRPPFLNSDSGLPTIRWSAASFNAETAAIRIRDVEGGADKGTHYLALVSDGQKQPGHLLQGLATAIPEIANPMIVAVAPAGSSWQWDQDQSYADWYGTHEFCHTIGRKHIGVPANGQRPDDDEYPYDGGRLSMPDGSYVGLDVGDPDLGIAMRALPPIQHHDVMSYASNQWLSDYTYRAVLVRLHEENVEFPP